MPKRTKKTTKTTSQAKTTRTSRVSKTPKKSVARAAKSSKTPRTTRVKKTTARVSKKVVVHTTPLASWISRHSTLIALLGLFLGIQLMCFSGWYLLYRRTILSFQVAPVVSVEQHQEVPVRIEIANQRIDLPIIPATINDGIWPVDDHNALHLATSAYPGERGNIVIYGHNTMPVFGNLKQVKAGDTITLLSDAQVEHTYVVKEVLRVKPSDIHVVLPTDHEVLTVYTCIGWLDSERLVLKAYPAENTTI